MVGSDRTDLVQHRTNITVATTLRPGSLCPRLSGYQPVKVCPPSRRTPQLGGTVTAATTERRLIGPDAATAAAELAAGHPIGHAFANFYVITTRADRATVRGINVMKGRPPEQ